MSDIQNKVTPISLGFVKVFLIKGKKNILVDTGISGNITIEKLKAVGFDPKSISYIIITHNHTDHVGGLKALKELSCAKIIMQRNDAELLANGKSSPIKARGFIGKFISKIMGGAQVQPMKADVIFDDELDLSEFGVDGKVIHTPGHTMGSLSILLATSELIIGDMLIGKHTKDGTYAKLPPFAIDVSLIKSSVKKLIPLAPRVIYTSHGDTCDVEAFKGIVGRI